MMGMRMGADRIVKCVKGIVNGYGLPEVMPWTSFAQRLGDDRGRIDAAKPFEFHVEDEHAAHSLRLLVNIQPLSTCALSLLRKAGIGASLQND